MCKIIGITNRHLCDGDYFEQIDKISKLPLEAIVVREKDLNEKEYEKLAQKVMEICDRNGTKCILHTYYDVAKKLKCRYIHVPLHILREYPELADEFCEVGVSTHSVDEAVEAEKLGAAYITAGHVFVTDCKKGLPPRGLDFLKNVCENTKIPVYAIGGIKRENIDSVIKCGAAGGCVMSSLMKY